MNEILHFTFDSQTERECVCERERMDRMSESKDNSEQKHTCRMEYKKKQRNYATDSGRERERESGWMV